VLRVARERKRCPACPQDGERRDAKCLGDATELVGLDPPFARLDVGHCAWVDAYGLSELLGLHANSLTKSTDARAHRGIRHGHTSRVRPKLRFPQQHACDKHKITVYRSCDFRKRPLHHGDAMTDQTDTQAQDDRSEKARDRTVTVTVNDQPVVLEDRHQTGAEIKASAIAAGVPIQYDFVLSEVRPNGKQRIIADDEPVNVKDGDALWAIPGDDNS
jgi:hypothetical protein